VVRWTERARADLRSIYEYIARDSPQDARSVVQEILRRAELLQDAPRMGRVVPELRQPELREIAVYSWRILYRLRQSDVFIVTLVHQRRNLDPAGLGS
jgi:addiction module RelE/StbE family toxin